MDTNNYNLTNFLKWFLFVLVITGLYSCAQEPVSPSPKSGKEEVAENENKSGDMGATATKADASDNTAKVEASSEATSTTAGPGEILVSERKVKLVTLGEPTAAEPAVATPSRIVKSCDGEPYGKYEKQARESIAKGLDATKAGKYGVGFRDLKEHKRWSGIHKNLFKNVNAACDSLSKCAKQNPKEKNTRCAQQAKVFDEWQAMSERFSKKAKMVEYTQPDKICSFEPNINDDPQCFHTLGDNVEKVCNSTACKEVADCWRGIGFLDLAIKQAATACGFAFKELSDCRGYTEAANRRVKKFGQCKDMQGSLRIVKFPAL